MSKTPKLRFKEFSGDWEENTLENISTHIKRTSGEVIENILTISAGRGFLEQKDRFSQVIAGNSLSKYTLLYENEFSYNRGNSKKYTYGCIYRLKDFQQALVPNVYISFKLNNQIERFYEQLFAKKYLDRQLRQLISSSARMDGLLNINKSEFFKVKVPVPSIEEQEKIASFFSLIEDKISLQGEKVEALKVYKKGMMQKIFSRELRFKDDDGRDYPDWEDKQVDELGEVVTGSTPSKSNSDYYNINDSKSKFPWITPTDITENKDIYKGETSLTEKGYNVSRKLPSNTILVTCIASIGKNAILKTEGSCNQQINAIIANNYNYYEFIYYLMEYKRNILKKFAGITATPILNKTDFSSLSFEIPIDIHEQIKISMILGKIDKKIEKEQEKLDYLNEYKKGLLQQMFV